MRRRIDIIREEGVECPLCGDKLIEAEFSEKQQLYCLTCGWSTLFHNNTIDSIEVTYVNYFLVTGGPVTKKVSVPVRNAKREFRYHNDHWVTKDRPGGGLKLDFMLCKGERNYDTIKEWLNGVDEN